MSDRCYSNNKVTFKIKTSTVFVWVMFLLLLFFSGFRWEVGIDWSRYMDMLIPNTLYWIELKEFIIKNIGLVIWTFGFRDAGYVLFTLAFFILFYFFYSIWRFSPAPVLSVLLFVCLGTYFDSLNGVRQYAAVALFVFSWQFLYSKKPISFFVTLLFATGFHSSALLMIPIYFIINHDFKRDFLIFVFCISIPLSFVIGPILPILASFSSNYEIYGGSYKEYLMPNTNPLSILRTIFPTILFIVCILLYDRLKKENIVILNLSLIYIFLTILFPRIMLINRIAFYFQAALIFLIPQICKQLSNWNANFFAIFTVIYGIIFVYITQINRPVSNIIPFDLDFRLANIRLLLLLISSFIISYLFVKIIPKLYFKKKQK